jgi:hypothetical protein
MTFTALSFNYDLINTMHMKFSLNIAFLMFI